MRNNSFAIFIMVWGRPDRNWTYTTLKRCGYTGDIYLVADNLDSTVDEYKKIYGDKVIVFDKNEAAKKYDAGDNTGDLRSTLYSANTIRELAKERGLKHYMIMCDDYTTFRYTFNDEQKFKSKPMKNLDKVLDAVIDFYEKTPAVSVAFAQGGDFIGGQGASNAELKLVRKAMNSFLCSTERPFDFVGRMNEDATTYVNLGSRGVLFFTITSISLEQTTHQSQEGGLTGIYLDWGTYVKSFFTVMYNPSCVKVREMGPTNKRMHHKIHWNNAVPRILDESVKK